MFKFRLVNRSPLLMRWGGFFGRFFHPFQFNPFYMYGQIIATSHDRFSPNGRVVGEPCLKWPYFREIQVGEIL